MTAHGAQSYIDTNASLAVSGTAQQIHATSTEVFRCEIFARKGNSGIVIIAPSASAATISQGIELSAGDRFKQESSKEITQDIILVDPSDWFFNGDNSGDEVLIHCDQ